MRLHVRPSPPPGRLDPEILWGILGAGILALIHLGPSPSLLHLPCLFKALSGIPCPTCGMTRAWDALGRLDWALALRMHPVLALGYFFLWAYIPYAAGAVLGLWPRMGVSVPPGQARGLRISALLAFAALWGFLIRDGR